MSGLRVAWVIYGSLDQVSGGYIYDRLVIEQLRALGDRVTVLSLEPNGAPPRLSRDDYDVVLGDELCFRELGPLFRDAPAGLRRVLLIHHLTAWEHAPGARQGELLALEKAAIDAADACIATSRVTADRLQRECLEHGALLVAEPGADRFERPASAGQEPSAARVRILFVGNLSPRKRVFELAQAFSELSSAQAELVLVGAELEPGYTRELRALIARAKLTERVHWLGSLDDAGVAEQLSRADVLVLPSALEGYGMVLSEALWSGVPIIAARVGAAEELVSRTSAGLLYAPDDARGLSVALASFVADRSLRARLRRAAWLSAEQLPRWKDTARAVRATLAKSR